MEKTNIIVIFPDQLRKNALSCYGDPNVCTPNIDNLAHEGVKFNNSYSVYPVCVPARFSMLTGQYPHTRLIPHIEWRMSPCEHTIADELNEAGYETCYIGKWHLYGGYAKGNKSLRKQIGTTYIPSAYRGGFKKWRAFDLRNDHFDTYYHTDYDSEIRSVKGYQTDGLFDIAINYLREERDFTKPFFMFLSVEAPHPPFQVPEEYLKRFEEKEIILPPNFNMNILKQSDDYDHEKNIIENYKKYYAMIENLDYNTGKLVRFLEDTGLRKNTAIIFTSDHGELMGSHGLTGKSKPYEEAAGVPLIISYPNKAAKTNEVIDCPVTTLDFYPTIQDMAGLPFSNNPGLSLMPMLKQNDCTIVERKGILLEHVSNLSTGGIYSPDNWRALRTERYKYTVIGPANDARPWQLFDLSSDPFELNNLLDNMEYRCIAKELDFELRTMIKETDDDYVIKNIF